MRQWTDEQLSAIQATNDEILVSAAAGSGKTSVMMKKPCALLRTARRLMKCS